MTSYELTPHERVEVTHRGVEALTVRASYAPGGAAPPMHLHPFQDERFEVLSGALTVEVHGERRTLWAGTALDVPRGTPHRMWNADGHVPAEVRWATTPPGRTEEWWRDLAAARGGRPRPPIGRTLRLLREYGDVFQLTVPVVGRLLHDPRRHAA